MWHFSSCNFIESISFNLKEAFVVSLVRQFHTLHPFLGGVLFKLRKDYLNKDLISQLVLRLSVGWYQIVHTCKKRDSNT